jgi:hypothetical protein
MQVTAELHVGHYDCAATERDVCGAGDGAAAGDFVARVLWTEGQTAGEKKTLEKSVCRLYRKKVMIVRGGIRSRSHIPSTYCFDVLAFRRRFPCCGS